MARGSTSISPIVPEIRFAACGSLCARVYFRRRFSVSAVCSWGNGCELASSSETNMAFVHSHLPVHSWQYQLVERWNCESSNRYRNRGMDLREIPSLFRCDQSPVSGARFGCVLLSDILPPSRTRFKFEVVILVAGATFGCAVHDAADGLARF